MELGPANLSARHPRTTQMLRWRAALLTLRKDDERSFNISCILRIESLVGRGQSSSRSKMTAGPSGSSIGTTWIIEWTTVNHPFSLSAITCNLSIDGGGSCSVSTRVLITDSVSNTRRSTWLLTSDAAGVRLTDELFEIHVMIDARLRFRLLLPFDWRQESLSCSPGTGIGLFRCRHRQRPIFHAFVFNDWPLQVCINSFTFAAHDAVLLFAHV